MALNGAHSAIVSEILNNVSVLSTALNRNNIASIGTSASADNNGSVEGEVQRIFRPGSLITGNERQRPSLIASSNNQMISQDEKRSSQLIRQDETRDQVNLGEGQNEQRQSSITGVTQTNIYPQSTTDLRLILQSEANSQPQNNLIRVNQQIQRPASGNLSTPYFLDRLNLTRKRKRRSWKEKSSNAKANSFYFKEIVLLTGPHDKLVPRQGTKLYLKQNQNIVRGVQFSKEWSEQQVVEKVKSLFGQKLAHCNFEFLESVYTQLVPPTLPPGETFNGMMFFNTFKDKVVYARPAEQVIPLPPQIPKSKKRAPILEDFDGCFTGIADEEDGYTDDEIYRCSGLSSRNDILDCSLPNSSLCGSTITQSSNHHRISDSTSISQPSNQHGNSNATVSVSQPSNSHIISDTTAGQSKHGNTHTTSIRQSSDQNSNTTAVVSQFSNQHSISDLTVNVGQSSMSDNAANAQEIPPVIDLTSEYAYAAMFETQCYDVTSDTDEGEDIPAPSEGIDPQPSSQEILRNLAVVINLDEISKFNISRSNLWESACRGFNRKSFSPSKKISVKFMDDIGQSEGAIDAGGPRREFLALLLEYLRNSSLFVGKSNCKFLTSYAQNMENGEYFLAGQIFSLTLVHGGPAPHFLAPQVFESLTKNPNNQKATIDDIYDLEFKQVLESLLNFHEISEVTDFLSTHSSLFELAGTLRPVRNIEDRNKIVNQTINWFVFGKTRPALEALKEGLKTLGVLEQIKKYPKAFEPLFIYQHKRLTADDIIAIFKVQRSLPGSNKFEKENSLLSFWHDLLIDIEEGESEITLEMVFSFATGCGEVPPIGFMPNVPMLAFLHDPESNGQKSKLPKANTCAIKLYLPTVHSKYDDFKNSIIYGISNTKGFGNW